MRADELIDDVIQLQWERGKHAAKSNEPTNHDLADRFTRATLSLKGYIIGLERDLADARRLIEEYDAKLRATSEAYSDARRVIEAQQQDIGNAASQCAELTKQRDDARREVERLKERNAQYERALAAAALLVDFVANPPSGHDDAVLLMRRTKDYEDAIRALAPSADAGKLPPCDNRDCPIGCPDSRVVDYGEAFAAPPADAGGYKFKKCGDCGQSFPPDYDTPHRTLQGEWCATPSTAATNETAIGVTSPRCNHEGIGLPGCHVCDPRVRADAGKAGV